MKLFKRWAVVKWWDGPPLSERINDPLYTSTLTAWRELTPVAIDYFFLKSSAEKYKAKAEATLDDEHSLMLKRNK